VKSEANSSMKKTIFINTGSVSLDLEFEKNFLFIKHISCVSMCLDSNMLLHEISEYCHLSPNCIFVNSFEEVKIGKCEDFEVIFIKEYTEDDVVNSYRYINCDFSHHYVIFANRLTQIQTCNLVEIAPYHFHIK
jgi:hypothetical protein